MADRTGLPHGAVRISCDDPSANLILALGAESPKITGGVGGWEITGRPRQVSMTTWAGVEPFQVALSVMLDGYAAGRSVESELRTLVAIARGDGESQPGLCRVTGIALPVDRWVIEAMEVGDALLGSDGERTRQPLTLTLREYVPPSYLQLRRSATQGAKGKTKVISSRKGDTPAAIARRQRCAWTAIRDLNLATVHKASQVLKTGTRLRVPVAAARTRRAATRQGTT